MRKTKKLKSDQPTTRTKSVAKKKYVKKEFDFYYDIFTLRKKPVTLEYIEARAEQMRDLAFNDPEMLKVTQLYRAMGCTQSDIDRWRKRSEKLDLMHDEAKQAIGDRREIGGMKKNFSESIVRHTMHHYDTTWKGMDEYQAALRKKDEEKPTQITVVMDNFGLTEKKPVDDGDKNGAL